MAWSELALAMARHTVSNLIELCSVELASISHMDGRLEPRDVSNTIASSDVPGLHNINHKHKRLRTEKEVHNQIRQSVSSSPDAFAK